MPSPVIDIKPEIIPDHSPTFADLVAPTDAFTAALDADDMVLVSSEDERRKNRKYEAKLVLLNQQFRDLRATADQLALALRDTVEENDLLENEVLFIEQRKEAWKNVRESLQGKKAKSLSSSSLSKRARRGASGGGAESPSDGGAGETAMPPHSHSGKKSRSRKRHRATE